MLTQLFKYPNRNSFDIVIRDHKGNLIEASSKCIAGLVSPEFAESVGIRETLSWVKYNNQNETIVETDCLQVVQLIRSSYSNFSYLGRVIEECRELLKDLRVLNTKLRFVKRSVNNVAHYLTKYSCSVDDRKWGVRDVNPDFFSLLCKDLN